ncbi:MAG TPA: hypothetical protein VLT34_18540, partial [Arthrobacter sp.]|nr:hypothetical protein [Arthrobacter sp.]
SSELRAQSSEVEGLGAANAEDSTVSGPASGWHPERANPSSTAMTADVRRYLIMLPLVIDVLTACPAGTTRSTRLAMSRSRLK